MEGKITGTGKRIMTMMLSVSFNGIICRTIPRTQLPVGNNGRTAARYRRLGRV